MAADDRPAKDQQIMARMLLEVVRADENLAPAEIQWLNRFLPAGAGTAVELSGLPPLTAEELATVSPDARMSALLMAWNVALVDSELAPQEEEILRHFAEGMGVSKHDAARAARIRRMEQPLQRLGIDPHRNPALFRFLDLCAEISGITKVDHCTFRCPASMLADRQQHWEQLGFTHHGEWVGKRHPARHIALVRGRPSGYPWEEMVGLLVTHPAPSGSEDGECSLQHIALNVSAKADLSKIRVTLEAHGVRFMTDILEVDGPDGSGLRQLFTAPPSSDGFFIEFIQRLPGVDGVPFSGFDVEIIDELYDAIDTGESVWRGLPTDARRSHVHWIPAAVVFESASI